MKKTLVIGLLSAFALAQVPNFLNSQNLVPFMPAEARKKGFEQRKSLVSASLAKSLPARAIGPSIFSCRVVDVDVRPDDPSQMLVAYASGGLWKTVSNGSRFEPLFDREAVMTIGDIAADWSRNIIWVGTGESNSSRSSYAGAGMFRSDDGGKTWQHRGLEETHHIGRVVLHPQNPDVVWVAAVGHLYSPNAERGIFKTSDGGKTWRRVLFVNENTGGIDLVIDPSNPKNLWAALWERQRRAWDFSGAGPGSGIWRSTDGGETWSLCSTPASGFPTGPGAGRIGLDIYQKEGKTALFAVIDNQNRKPADADKTKADEALKPVFFKNISKADFDKLPDEQLEKFLRDNDFDEKYSASSVRKMIAEGTIEPKALNDYFEQDANPNLSETDVIGAELYRSDDGGASWRRLNEGYLDGLFYTYGYYFGQLNVSPHSDKKIYLMGVPIVKSEDGGATFKTINGRNVHADHHFLWENPARPGHLVNGNDGGLNISYDDGKSWFKLNSPPVGQFYAVQVDAAEPYNVYGGAQDNGVWWGSSQSELDDEWLQEGKNPYQMLLGGDGMQVMVDPRDNSTVYAGSQFGAYSRIDKNTGEARPIGPQHKLGERPYRWNWQSPILLSKHQPDVLYLGAQKLFRSLDKGKNWEAISGDLTLGSRKGNVPFGTLTAIAESPLKFGLLAVGSDDGLIHVSKDGGETWKKVSDHLPQNLWVSRVVFSSHEKGRLYVALNGYRWDDFAPYLFVSNDFGETWQRLGADLPAEPLNVVREDGLNPDLLFVGSDHAAYFSLDRGRTFQALSKNIPSAPVHDLAVQPTAKELVVGTHGRGLYIVDISNLEQLTPAVLGADLVVFDIPKKRWSAGWGKSWNRFMPLKDPEMTVNFYSKSSGEARWKIHLKDSKMALATGSMTVSAGINALALDLSFDEKKLKDFEKALNEAASKEKKPSKTIKIEKADTGKFYLYKGAYEIEFEKDGKLVSKPFELVGRGPADSQQPKPELD